MSRLGGLSAGLQQRLAETKQRLLAKNAEAAKAGFGRAEHGAWAAHNAERQRKGSGKGKKGLPVVREELVALNRQIASYAQAKDLSKAQEVFKDLEARGWANGHSYAAAVHALCRCKDWQKAEEALLRAEKKGLFKRHRAKD